MLIVIRNRKLILTTSFWFIFFSSKAICISFYSWDELAKFDMPATLLYILNYTQSSSLSYVGHSQGTTIAFAEFSRNQTLASKVDLFIALAPVAYVGNMVSPLRYLSYFTGEIEVV